MVNEYQQFTKRNLVALCIQEIFDIDSFEKIKELYPTRFDDPILDKFEGACFGNKKNEIGKVLEEYCKKVQADELEQSQIKLYEFNELSMLDLTKFDRYDLLVLNFGSLSREEISDLLEKVLSDGCLSLLILFDENRKGLEVISDIMCIYSRLKAKLLVFKQEDTLTIDNFRENITLGTLVVNGGLKTAIVESYCESVDSVVSQILPSGGKIAIISDVAFPKLKLDASFSCNYYGSFLDLEVLKKSLDDNLSISYSVVDMSKNLSSSESLATESPAEGRRNKHSTLLNSSPGTIDFGESMIMDEPPECK